MDFAEQLKKTLDKMGITQRELSEKMGVDSSYISRLATGRSKPNWETIENIAAALNISPVAIFDDDEKETLRVALQDLPEDLIDFIRNKQNHIWLLLAKEQKETGFRLESIRKAVELLKELENK
jgi:transcriptional regulator with XRE-family HTH domain